MCLPMKIRDRSLAVDMECFKATSWVVLIFLLIDSRIPVA